MTYRSCIDQAARERYGLRHFQLARAKFNGAAHVMPAAAAPLQYYLRTVQEHYPHF